MLKKKFAIMIIIMVLIIQTTTIYASTDFEINSDFKFKVKTPLTLINNRIYRDEFQIVDYEGLFFISIDTLSYLSKIAFSIDYEKKQIYALSTFDTRPDNLYQKSIDPVYADAEYYSISFFGDLVKDIPVLIIDNTCYIAFNPIAKKSNVKYWYIRNGKQLRFSTDDLDLGSKYTYMHKEAEISYSKLLSNFDTSVNPTVTVNGAFPIFEMSKIFSNYQNWDMLIKPTITYAIMAKDSTKFKKGDRVIIREDTGNGTNYLISKDGIDEWVKYTSLEFLPLDYTRNEQRLTKSQLEDYIAYKEYSSETNHLIYVDIDRSRTYIFEKDENEIFKLIKDEICTTGNEVTITVRGTFKISEPTKENGWWPRDTWFYAPSVASGAKYWVKFYKGYMFHSITYKKDKVTIDDDSLGERASHGCIRLETSFAKWIYDNIEEKTTVVIY